MSSVRPGTPKYLAWLLPGGTLFYMCGILIGRSAEDWVPALAALVCSVAAGIVSRRWYRTMATLMAALFLGVLLAWHAYHPALPAEGDYLIRGTVVQLVNVEEDGHVQTRLAEVRLNGQPGPDAYWTFYLDEEEPLPEWLIPGVRVEMTARVYHPSGKENPGGFDFKEYLLQQNIRIGIYGADEMNAVQAHGSLQGMLAELRHALSLQLEQVMGDEAGEYAAAMLLGMQDILPDEDVAAFRKLGVAHILSVSGYHVGVLAGMLLLLLRPLPVGRRSRLLLELVILGAYSLLCGGNAPVVRAVGLLLWREFTRLRNRQIVPLHMLCVTAVAQLMFNPSLLTGASFQLSYGAMLGLLLVFPWLKNRRACKTLWGNRLWEAFAAALSAQLGILLPQLYWFGELPLLSILFNMALIPYAGAMMSLYWLTLAALPVPGVKLLLGWLSAQATSFLLMMVRWLASLDLAALWTRQADIVQLVGWVLLLWSLSVLVPNRMARRRRAVGLTGVVLLLLILIPLPENETTYTQFDVGNADAAILQDGDLTVVIDLGEDGKTAANYLHQRRQTVEMLILTHLHTDHAGGIQALMESGVPVKVCCLPGDAAIPVIDAEVLPLLQALAETGTEFRTLNRGDVIKLPSGRLTVMWPEEGRVSSAHDANDVCLVMQAEIAGVTMLLTSDLSGMYERHLAVPADILKVAHHGSASSTSEEFLEAVAPQVLLLSNGDDAREARMAELAGEIPLYSTEQSGAVTIHFAGNGLFEIETVK